MNAIGIGPFVFAADRLSAILGIVAFMIAASIVARRFDGRIARFANWAIVVGLIAARAGHVLIHLDSFLEEPWRVFAVWQGGFEPIAGLLGVLAVAAFQIRTAGTAFAATGTVALGLLVWGATTELTRATLGQPAPTFAMARLDGPPMAIGDVTGRPAVVNVWATWCPPCRREMPLLAEVAGASDDVAFLFVNQGEGPDTIRAYLRAEKLTLDTVLLDRAMQVPGHYQTVGVPITLFLRSDGTLASMHVGEISREALRKGIARISG